jgi:glycosyltransferase involved in cell wall biosynthesis
MEPEAMNRDYPKISIMIPTYNRAHYLVDAVESVLAQDYPNFEIIISDNASTDGTREVIEKYLGDARVRYYRNDRNLGIGPNWTRLLYEYARGDYGKCLPDDDYLVDGNHLKKAMAIIRKYNVKIVFSAAVSKFEDGEGDRDLSLELDEFVPRSWWLDHVGRTNFGVTCFPSCCSGQVFEIASAKELGFLTGEPFGDYEYALKLILSEEGTGYIKEPSYLERRHAGQDGWSSYQSAVQGTKLFDHIRDYGRRMGTVDEKTLDEIRLRGIKFFARAFLMPNWTRENGRGPASLMRFLRELRAFDERLPKAVLTDFMMVTQFFLYGSYPYRKLRRLYRAVRSAPALKSLRQRSVKTS